VKFLVDNQLPAALARFLIRKGHDATHVLDIGLAQTDDERVWAYAATNSMIVVSKDEDFLHLTHRANPPGRLLWIRVRNCRNSALIEAVDKSLQNIIGAFDSGQMIVELR